MNNALTAGLIVLAIATGWLYFRPTTASTPILGSVTSSQALTSPYCVDGYCHYDFQHQFTAATTTPWNQTGPSATTTLGKFGCTFFGAASTTAATEWLATSTTNDASTTLIGQFATAANAGGTLVSTTTYNNGTLVPPNTHFVLAMTGGVGTFSPTGACFLTLNAVAPSSP